MGRRHYPGAAAYTPPPGRLDLAHYAALAGHAALGERRALVARRCLAVAHGAPNHQPPPALPEWKQTGHRLAGSQPLMADSSTAGCPVCLHSGSWTEGGAGRGTAAQRRWWSRGAVPRGWRGFSPTETGRMWREPPSLATATARSPQRTEEADLETCSTAWGTAFDGPNRQRELLDEVAGTRICGRFPRRVRGPSSRWVPSAHAQARQPWLPGGRPARAAGLHGGRRRASGGAAGPLHKATNRRIQRHLGLRRPPRGLPGWHARPAFIPRSSEDRATCGR